MTEDTISQTATAPGAGGIGIIRMSGAQALPIARRVFRPAAARSATWRPIPRATVISRRRTAA